MSKTILIFLLIFGIPLGVVCLYLLAALAAALFLWRKRNIRQWQKILREEPDFTPYEDITPDTIRFIVAIEDYKFWKHRGINLSNIYYSAKHNIKRYLRIISRGDHSGDVRGGSTISQQLVKNMYFNYRKSYFRKVMEMFITLWMERSISKEEIMELYMNFVFFGNGQYGIRQAARYYFDCAPEEMTVSQSLFLLPLLFAPTMLNPYRVPESFFNYRQIKVNELAKYSVLQEPELTRQRTEYTSDYPADNWIPRAPAKGTETIPVCHPRSLTAPAL